MKKVILGFVFLIFAGLAGAAVYVTNIDWNQHKDKIAEQFYNSTGKIISFDGRVSFKIFPTPYLSAVNAKVYNDDKKGGKPLLEIQDVVAELALMPLLNGEFDIKKMVLDGAVINIDWDGNGVNWQGDLSPDQRQMMEETKMVLNSVSLKNAVVNVESEENNVHFQLTNLNGEVSAQSIFGPFRIEGNYLKGSSPEGFALSIGKMSESFATSLNMVVTHPQSESYIRFDGTFHLTNRVLNGNAIIETQRLNEFVNANFASVKLSPEYGKPAALGFDIALNPKNLNLSNIVVKYGETQGAGTLEMPLDNTETPEITTGFEFSDLELEPFVAAARRFIDKYKEEAYAPEYNIDLTAEIKAGRASYQGQGLKNLTTEFSLDDDTLTIDDFSVILPGDTSLRLKGSVYPYEEQVYYQLDTNITANDLIRTLKWLNIEPKANAASVYKKMLLTAKAAGNFEKVQISPYKITLDKSTLSGEAGLALGERNDIMLVVNADTINFDNYISSLPEEEKSKSWTERMAYRFGKLGILNDFDMVLNAKADLVIYESMPFEKVDLKGNILNGKADIEYCKIEQVANTAVGIKGQLSGFGMQPQMDNLQYEIKSSDIASLINKLELKVPNLDYKRFNNLNMNGMINGTTDNFGINTQAAIGNLNLSYRGKASQNAGLTDFDGILEAKHPDFVKLLNNLKVKYDPSGKNLGLFQFKGDIKGNQKDFEANNLDVNIGYTTLNGSLRYDHSGERPNIMGQMKINRLEIDKFLQKTKEGSIIRETANSETEAFLAKPFWSRDKIDYSPYIYADINGNFEVQELSYKSHLFKDAKFRLELADGTANINEFTAVYNNAPTEAAVSLYMRENPSITGNVKLAEAEVNNFGIGGKIYNLKGGKFTTRFDFNSKADSEQSFAENLKGKAEFSATATEAGGINLTSIHKDLLQRESSAGLAEKIKSNLGTGKTALEKISGRAIADGGKFSLADAVINTKESEIKIYGEGDIETWDMNIVFNVKYNEPKYLPEFSFSLKNSMENPTVDVDVSSLFKLYKSKEEQQEAAAAAEIEAEKNYWKELIEEQRKAADDLVLTTRAKLEKEVENKAQNVITQESAAKYNQLKQDIANTLTRLIETTDGINPENGNNEVLKTLTAAVQKALSEIESYGKRKDEIYLSDLKKQNELEYNKIVEAHNDLKQAVFAYNANQDKYTERLSKIITDYALDKDEEFQTQKQKIDEAVSSLEKLNDEAVQAQQMKKFDASIEEYKTYNKNLKDVYESLKTGRQTLIAETKALDDYVLPKISIAEQDYYAKVENEENQRRIEENTGSISIKKTGRTVTVTRDIEDIKQAEQEISKEGVKVLDFSREKIERPAKEKDTAENVIKKGRNIRPN